MQYCLSNGIRLISSYFRYLKIKCLNLSVWLCTMMEKNRLPEKEICLTHVDTYFRVRWIALWKEWYLFLDCKGKLGVQAWTLKFQLLKLWSKTIHGDCKIQKTVQTTDSWCECKSTKWKQSIVHGYHKVNINLEKCNREILLKKKKCIKMFENNLNCHWHFVSLFCKSLISVASKS